MRGHGRAYGWRLLASEWIRPGEEEDDVVALAAHARNCRFRMLANLLQQRTKALRSKVWGLGGFGSLNNKQVHQPEQHDRLPANK